MQKRVLVTGGAGYIGSHMAKILRSEAFEVRVFDNLSTGHSDSVRSEELIVGDLTNWPLLSDLLEGQRFDAVMHFAANCYVGESMTSPEKYLVNNVAGTLNLLRWMRASSVKRLIFSSSCSTYGDPAELPIKETHAQRPVNAYGRTKLMCEEMMIEYARAYDLDVISLRYFNAAGCDPSGELGERHDPETHLIPLVLAEARRQISNAGTPGLQVFGTDFDTADGTCVRDFVHVNDLCNAHLLALKRQFGRGVGGFEAFNLGTEDGASVKEVIAKCSEVTGIPIPYTAAPRRLGDPARLVADSSLARQILGWTPHYCLADIIATAWAWQAKQPQQ